MHLTRNASSVVASSIAVLAACGQPARQQAQPQPAGGPPYAALFEDGRTWRYHLSRRESCDGCPDKADFERSKRDSQLDLACRARARTFGAVRVAQLECGTHASWVANAIFVATDDGLRALAGADLPTNEASARALIMGEPLIAPVPTEARREDGDGWRATERAGDTWCVEWGVSKPVFDSTRVCFDAARGITQVVGTRVDNGIRGVETTDLTAPTP